MQWSLDLRNIVLHAAEPLKFTPNEDFYQIQILLTRPIPPPPLPAAGNGFNIILTKFLVKNKSRGDNKFRRAPSAIFNYFPPLANIIGPPLPACLVRWVGFSIITAVDDKRKLISWFTWKAKKIFKKRRMVWLIVG